MIGIFDTHAHYDDMAFDLDRDAVLRGMAKAGVTRIVNAGASLDSCYRTLALTKEYPFVYGAVGIHPDELADCGEDAFWQVARLAEEEKILAVGEIGLDYFVPSCFQEDSEEDAGQKGPDRREKQKEWFIRQLDLARQLHKPVVIHSREAAQDTLDIVKKEAADLICDIHCFSYGVEMAREYLNRGHYLGIGGVLTFKNARKLKEVVEYMPLDRILLETDCPYLSPVPYRGKRNTSANLWFVAEEIGRIKGISTEEVIRITYVNAMCFYQQM